MSTPSKHDIPAPVKAVLNTLSVSSTRATFLAGFTFYQVGRYSFTPGNDTMYIVCNTIALVLGILAACISALITYFMERATTYDGKLEYQKLVNNWYIRVAFQCFCFGTVFYFFGLSRMGFVYYPDGAAKWIPFVILLPVGIVIYPLLMYVSVGQIIKTAEQEKIILGKLKASGVSSLTEEERVWNNSIAEASHLPALVSQQADGIASRALFLGGMIQNGIMRYAPTTGKQVQNNQMVGCDECESSGLVFLFFCTVATALSLSCAMCLSTLSIFIRDVGAGPIGEDGVGGQRLAVAYALYTQNAIRNFVFVFYLSVVCMIFGVILLPYGEGYPSFGNYNVVIGTGGLIVLLYAMYDTKKIKDEVTLYPVRTMTEDEASSQVNRILSPINYNGSQATLASAFVFYNIVTFGTDVLPLVRRPDLETVNYMCGGLFLLANNLAIIGGLTSALIDVIITNTCLFFKDSRDRYQVLAKCNGLAKLVDLLFYLALASWFMIFILFGITKYDPFTYLNIAFGIVGIVLTVGGVIYMNQKSTYIKYTAQYIRIKDGPVHPDNDADEVLNDSKMAQFEGRQDAFNSMAFNVLFLGGFAYNATCFFNFQDQEADNTYLSLMSLSFMFSLAIVSWTSFYNIEFLNCNTPQEKYYLNKATNGIFEFAAFLSYFVIFLLLIAWCMIGYVKSHAYYPNYEEIAPIMTVASAVALVLCHLLMGEIVLKYKTAENAILQEGVKESRLNISDDEADQVGDFNYRRLVNQIGTSAKACSFVAGNVCYEILFSVAAASNEYKNCNYLYFILLNTTFVAGVAVTAAKGAIDYNMNRLDSEQKRQYFGLSIRPIKYQVFALTLLSLFCWIASIMFLGIVKYPNKIYQGSNDKGGLYWPSLSFGIAGTVSFIYMFFDAKYKSNCVREMELKAISKEARDIELPESKGVKLSQQENNNTL